MKIKVTATFEMEVNPADYPDIDNIIAYEKEYGIGQVDGFSEFIGLRTGDENFNMEIEIQPVGE